MINRSFALALVLCCAGASSLRAQAARQALLDSLVTVANPEAAAILMVEAVDPNLGSPADSLWGVAVVRLAELLILDLDMAEDARVWLRWAIRLHPDLAENPPDTETEVLAALQRERIELGTITVSDHTATYSWANASLSGNGALEVNRRLLPQNASVFVVGRGELADSLTLPVGSYDVELALDGQIADRITHDVLPGVSTVLNFAVDVAEAESEPDSILTASGGGGGFPAVAILGILGAAGAAAAFVLGGGSDNGGGGPATPASGGIIVSLPKS